MYKRLPLGLGVEGKELVPSFLGFLNGKHVFLPHLLTHSNFQVKRGYGEAKRLDLQN